MDRQGRIVSTTDKDKKGKNVSLYEALDIGEDRKGVTMILIKGNPGMGKSTLAVNICKCWVEGSLLNCYDCVIMLTLRDSEIQAAKTINDLLLIPNEELNECVVKEITSNFGERICFILEGYDELPESLRISKSSIFTKLKEKLPNCTLVYTSRPEACDKLESVATRVIKIQGFKKKSIDKYISSTFEKVNDGEKLASQLKSELQNNSVVNEILHIPINVAIVCLIFFYFSTLPETLTELYKLLILRLILRHIRQRTDNVTRVQRLESLDHLPEDISDHYSSLCYIAYKGIENKIIIFTSKYLLNMNIAEKKMSNLGLLVTAPSTSIYGREKSYNFLHKTLQEFCTAWYISKLSLEDQLKCINTHWNDDNYIMVWTFYSGITGLNNKKVLNCILPYKLVKSNLTERRILRLMDCMYEAHNSELCQIVGDLLDHFDGGIDVYYRSVHVIAYFLTSYKKAISKIQAKYLFDDDFQTLVESILHRTQCQYVKDNIILDVSDCNVTHQSMSCLTRLLTTQYPIVEIYFRTITFLFADDRDSSCGDHETSTYLSNMQLLSKILTSSNTLRVLDISETNIGPEGAVCFANIRKTSIGDLRMAECELGPTGADKIGEMLYHNNSIVSIDLSKNKMMDSGVERLVHHLSKSNKLQNLNLRDNTITAVGANHLSRLIATDHPTLTSIELSDNPLGDEGVKMILSSISVTIKHIGLVEVDMTSSSYPILATVLHKTKSISVDSLDDYDDDENCCVVVCDSLATTTMLKQLELHDIWVSDSINLVLNAIRQNDVIETLKLNDYQAIGENFFKLLENSKVLMTLTIDTYNLTPQDMLMIADSLTVNNSVRSFQLADMCLDQSRTLSFLEQLKQTVTVKEVMLGVDDKANEDYMFLEDVEKRVQQINHIRDTKDVSSQLTVKIVSYIFFL